MTDLVKFCLFEASWVDKDEILHVFVEMLVHFIVVQCHAKKQKVNNGRRP